MIEVKEAEKSHTLSGAYLDRLFRYALQNNKEPRLVIVFKQVKLRLDIRISRNLD